VLQSCIFDFQAAAIIGGELQASTVFMDNAA
jgi:hypothetical protein